MGCGSSSMLVLNDVYVGTDTGEVTTVQSRSVPMSGNVAVGSFLILNSSGSPTITLKIQGSYDNVMWDDITNTTSSGGLDRKTLTGTAVKYPFVRLQVSISGTTVKVLVRAWIAITAG